MAELSIKTFKGATTLDFQTATTITLTSLEATTMQGKSEISRAIVTNQQRSSAKPSSLPCCYFRTAIT